MNPKFTNKSGFINELLLKINKISFLMAVYLVSLPSQGK